MPRDEHSETVELKFNHMPSSTTFTRVLLLCLPALLFGACGDDPVGPGFQCEVDEALLAQRTECVLDESCPCGSHCELGLCVATCGGGAACESGQFCDSMGRCRNDGETSIVPAPTGAVVGRVVVSTPRLLVRSQDEVVRFSIRGEEAPVGLVRIAAGERAEVRCSGAVEFAPECVMSGIGPAAEGAVTVEVRATATADEEDLSSEIGVFWAGRHTRVGLVIAAPGGPSTRGDHGASASGGPGSYAGFARPIAYGRVSRSAREDLPEAQRTLVIPISAQVFDDDTISFVDSLSTVFPKGEAVGTLIEPTSGHFYVDMADQLYIESNAAPVGGVEIIAEYRPNQVDAPDGRTLPESGEALILETQAVMRGASLNEWSPFVTWEISLVRMGNLPAGAMPPPPSDADVATLTTARAETAFPSAESAWFGGVTSSVARVRSLLCASIDGATETLCGEHVTAAGGPQAHGDFGCISPVAMTTDCATDPTTASNLAFGLLQSNLLQVENNINECMADLSLDPDALRGCVDVERALGAVAEAFENDRARAGGALTSDAPASALGLRVLQQWLDTHSFIAREAAQLRGLSAVHPMGASNVTANVDEALERSQLGWDLFLHPRVGVALAGTEPDVIVSPDYRARIEPSYVPRVCDPTVRSCTEVQGLGLPVTMLTTLRDQARVHTDLLVAAMERADGLFDEAPLSDYFRRSVLALAIARSLVDTALPRAPEWEDEWDVAVEEHGRAVTVLFNAYADLQAGRNPLGIEDDDLPLYRIGDEVGANNRFSALSDYLLGAGTTDRAIAPFMVNRAAEELSAAQDAYQENLERDFAASTSASMAGARLEQTNRRYGEQIISLCGVPGAVSDTVLLQEIDPTTCYIVDACRPADADRLSRLNVADEGFALCMATELRSAFGANVTTGDRALDARVDSMRGTFDNATTPFALQLQRVAGGAELRGTSGTFIASELSRLRVDAPDGGSSATVQLITDQCGSQRQATLALRPTLDCPDAPAVEFLTTIAGIPILPVDVPARCTALPACDFSDDCPATYSCDAGECAPDLADVVAQRGDCYQGSIGEAALGLRGAARDVEIARQELNDLADAYDNAVTSCGIAEEGRSDIADASRQHATVMNVLSAVKLAADVAANAAAAVKDAGGADDNLLSAGRQAAGAVIEGIANSVSETLAFSMEVAEREHALFIQGIADRADYEVCLNDARMHFVGIKTASLRIDRAMLGVAQQRVAFDGLVGEAQGVLVEGRAAVRNEVSRRVPPIAIDYWLDQRITTYRDYMKQARRAVYLTVLAVEYEFQLTSDARSRVLMARSPQDLTNVIDDLRSFTLTGRVGGGSPTNRLSVVSVRDHLLQLADHNDYPEGWPALTAAQRFQALLASERYSIRDANGVYLGQQIPFNLSPVGTLGIGLTQGVEILSGNSCAERLWSVALAVQGPDPLPGSPSSIVPLSIRHRNTFISQWCEPPSDMEFFRTASVRPSKNLFRDPYDDTSITDATPTPPDGLDETRGYTDATIDARLNVALADLESDSYSDGLSYELAGRGLYGEYALWIPASRDATPSPLSLEGVEDVLLRIEYLSVSR